MASLGPEWVLLSLFGDSGFLDSLDEFARQAFTYAQAAGADAPTNACADHAATAAVRSSSPGSDETLIQPEVSTSDPPYLYIVAGIIFLFAAWGASFSRSCQSDGCIGIVFPLGGALIALAVQIFVLIPMYRMTLSRAGEPAVLRVGAWIAASVSAFALPMLFAKI